jgi:hypothetical protein
MHCRFYEAYILCVNQFSVWWVIFNVIKIDLFFMRQSQLLCFRTLYTVCYSRKHNFPQNGYVCAIRWKEGRHLLRWVRCKKVTAIIGPNTPKREGVSHPFTWGRKHIQLPKRCTRYDTGRWAKSKNPVPASVLQHRQNAIELIHDTDILQQTKF